jgi:hypothetical protein
MLTIGRLKWSPWSRGAKARLKCGVIVGLKSSMCNSGFNIFNAGSVELYSRYVVHSSNGLCDSPIADGDASLAGVRRDK